MLTLKAPTTNAADDNFCDIFPNFRKNGMILHENRLPSYESHEISWFICYFWKSGKIWNCRLLQIIGGALWVKTCKFIDLIDTSNNWFIFEHIRIYRNNYLFIESSTFIMAISIKNSIIIIMNAYKMSHAVIKLLQIRCAPLPSDLCHRCALIR